MRRQDFSGAAGLFTEDGFWRDLVAFTWDVRTFRGRTTIEAGFEEYAGTAVAGGFRLEDDQDVEIILPGGFNVTPRLAQALKLLPGVERVEDL